MNKNDLHPYQLKSIQHILDTSHCGLFLEMGLGKTVSTLTAIDTLIFEELEIDTVLVIAPKRVVESVWAEEIHKWDHLKRLKAVKIIGDQSQRISAVKTKAHIYLISRDNIAWLCGHFGGVLPYSVLVIDELSSFKNPQAVRFKALRKAQPSFHRVIGLTGTPAPNGLIDLWSQIYLLDRGDRLGKFITAYREVYFKPDKKNGSIVYSYALKKENEAAIHDKIKDICISMSAKDYLDLPGRITNIVKIDMPADIRKKYDDFERDKVLELVSASQDDVIPALSAAALSNKLLQFANGAVYDEDGIAHVFHDLKIDALKEIIEEAGGKPVLIAWTFRSDLVRLKEAIKGLRELKDNRDINDWNAGKIPVLAMHPASGGHGLNLQAGGHIIVWFGQNWSLELEQQFNARLDRQGQEQTVIIHKLVMNGTIDQDVIRALESKNDTQQELMEAVKARIAKYTEIFK